MKWPFKKDDISSRECLMCGFTGPHKAEIHYAHQGGADVAYLCDDCADDIQEPNVGDEDESL